MVRDDDAWLADEAEAPQLDGACAALQGLARADVVGEQHGGFADDPRHGGVLVVPQGEVGGQARQGQPRPVIGPQDDGVETVVVLADQHVRPVGVLPQPLAEPLLQLGGLLHRRRGLFEVQDVDVGVAADAVLDLDAPLLEQGLGEVGGGVALRAPGGQGPDAVLGAFDVPDLAAGVLDVDPGAVEQFAEELLDDVGADPRGAEAGVDLAGSRSDGWTSRRAVTLAS